jgi:DNA polymerase I-like protein with 3'-5' exonuclease and polymerase domains/uracil-DNA glycosylase
MRSLPLYPEPPASPVDSGGEPLDRACTRCAWSVGDGRACLPAEGKPGGLLVVGEAPVKDAARPFASKSGVYLRSLIDRTWAGPVVYDTALKCPAPGKAKTKDALKPLRECRPYLAEVVAQTQPTRVLSLGPWASFGLVGRALDVDSSRRGYGWILGNVPVFFAGTPLAALENKFIRQLFERDVHWALTAPIPRPAYEGVVHVVTSHEDALAAWEALELCDEVLFDVETAGIMHNVDFQVLCAGVGAVDELETDAWVWSEAALADPNALGVLRRILTTKAVSGSNIKYDMIAAEQCLGISIKRLGSDTQMIRKLAEPTSYGRLDYVAELVGLGGHKQEMEDALAVEIRHARLKKQRPGHAPHDHWCSQAIRNGTPGSSPKGYAYGLVQASRPTLLHRYNARDVVTSAAGVLHLRKRTVEESPRDYALWEELYRPVLPSLARIERVGIQADRQAFEAFSAYLNIGIAELREKFKAWGDDFNPNSTAQVAHILFNKLKLPKRFADVSEKTGALSTDKGTLEQMRGMHPFVDQLAEFRRIDKLDGTYARGGMEHILSDGRVHPTFKPDGTETCRISSERPNGQNLPRPETLEGKMCRDCYTASPGNILLELDMSQVELRVMAGMSGDKDMIQIFLDGLDYHMRTAQLVSQVAWRIPPDMVTEMHRSLAKIINFSLAYGKGDPQLAKEMGCSIEEARRVRQAILGKFKKLDEMLRHLAQHARRFGWVEIPWSETASHKRPLYDAGSHDRFRQGEAERAGKNTPIQGRAAMYILDSLPKIHAWIDRVGAQAEIVNTVHDSILFDCHPDWVDLVVQHGTGIMEDHDCWGVPLIADAKAGERWGSLRKIKRGEKFAAAQVRWAADALKKSAVA